MKVLFSSLVVSSFAFAGCMDTEDSPELGDTEQAFAWLERAHQERRGWLAYLKVEPMFDPVRADPRFAEWVRRMRL